MDGYKIICLVFCLFCVVRGKVIVETGNGKVAGVEIESIIKGEKFYSFYSIPYAEPPVGGNRFMPPKSHSGWDGVLENKKEKKPCAHFNLPIRYIVNYGFAGSEDCLYLSVHTPQVPKEDLHLPVIVFIYNENFKIAFNASREYGPDFFMKENVIIVTFQHRLGSLGFLSFGDDLLPGNNGLRDAILAIKWVKTNINKFGGDPNKITLMGSHGGAVLVDLLLHSPKAKGLFSAAIMQSGTSWNNMWLSDKGKERAIALSKELEEHATTSSYLLKRFSEISAKTITEIEDRAVHADEARIIQRGMFAFGPVVEHEHPDAVITEYPENKTNELNIPVMIGYNSREGIELTERFLRKPMYLTFAERDFVFLFPYRVNHHFDIHSEVYRHAIKELKEFYFDEGYVKISRPGEYLTYLQDMMVFYPIDYAVRKYTNNTNNSVYYYMFDFSGDFNLRKQINMEEAATLDGTWGASTCDELCYLFVCKKLKKQYIKALEDEESEEIKVIQNMIKLWTNFAKTGKPSAPEDEVEWKPATKENKECLVISDELQLKTKLHDKRITFWDEFLEKYAKLAVDGLIKDVKDEL